VKRLLLGRPIATADEDAERLPKVVALPTFSSDAVSSTAYATQEILFVVAAGSSSLALGLARLVPISVAVAVLLLIVVTSYRQTIFAYPGGGGSYIVSRENLGRLPSLVAGASLLVDYVLTVAVSISAGVAAIVSMPGLADLNRQRVLLCVGLVVLMTLVNLRGLRQSGALFAVPFYTYLAVMAALLVVGHVRTALGDIGTVPFHAGDFTGVRETGGTLGLFLVLKGFSSGAVALTGVEAISNGVPAFREPRPRNAARTLVIMAVILGVGFFGVSALAADLHPYPSNDRTVLSQMGLLVFGNGPVYVILQVATAAILTLAANTAYADFPRLSSILARDGFLPRQLSHRGERLVFSNGIVVLAAAAALLLVAFDGLTNALVPLYAVGVFTAFTLSQTGMVRHHLRAREDAWRLKLAVNGIGAVATFVVLLVVAATKFTDGAWIPVVLVPLLVVGLLAIRRRYDRWDRAVALVPPGPAPVAPRRGPSETEPATAMVAVVVVTRVNAVSAATARAALSLRPRRAYALHVADPEDAGDPAEVWAALGLGVDLTIVPSPFRAFTAPLLERLRAIRAAAAGERVVVFLPEVVSQHWYDAILLNRSAVVTRERLVEAGFSVETVPYALTPEPGGGPQAGRDPGGSDGIGAPSSDASASQ
jgi:amino acid transporter